METESEVSYNINTIYHFLLDTRLIYANQHAGM